MKMMMAYCLSAVCAGSMAGLKAIGRGITSNFTRIQGFG